MTGTIGKICDLCKLQTVRKSKFYGAEIWGMWGGWEIINGVEGRIGKKCLKVDVLRTDLLN